MIVRLAFRLIAVVEHAVMIVAVMHAERVQMEQRAMDKVV
jgi:hypothetical protein